MPGSRRQEKPGQWLPGAKPEEKFTRPEFELDSLHKTAMISTPHRNHPAHQVLQELGVDRQLLVRQQPAHAEKKKSLALFIEQVVPAFR